MTKHKYFAYGSTMLLSRLRERAPSAEAVDGVYAMPGYTLRFHKYSHKDGSGKCDVFFTGKKTDIVYGRIFLIEVCDIRNLDKHAGVGAGYYCCDYQVHNIDTDQETHAFMYHAQTRYTCIELEPTAEYKQYVLDGAREGDLPEEYIKKMIEEVEVRGERRVKPGPLFLMKS